MPNDRDTFSNGYAASLEDAMENNRKAIREKVTILSNKIDIAAIKLNLEQLSRDYENKWKKSWRSSKFFGSATRESHINELTKNINNLSVEGLLSFLGELDQEIAYAIGENGHNYADTLKQMRSALTESFTEDVRTELSAILGLTNEIQRLTLKQRGEEATYQPMRMRLS